MLDFVLKALLIIGSICAHSCQGIFTRVFSFFIVLVICSFRKGKDQGMIFLFLCLL